MFFRILYQAQNKLTHIIGLILLFFAYFSDFLIAEPLTIFFQISYFVGQILVNKFLSLCKYTVEVVYLVYSLFQVLYEDSLVFVKDATEKFTYAIYLMKYAYLCLEELVWICVRGICGIGQALGRGVAILHHVIASIRNSIHLIGSTIWKFLILTPETIIFKIDAIIIFIVNTFKDLVSSISKCFSSILEWLKKIYLFFFDIPLDSVFGLIIGTVLLIVIYIYFHEIRTIISQSTVKFYKQMINLGISLWTGKFLEKRTRTNFGHNPQNDERLCIVCQHHLKEIIIFPCKHLCLCGDCSLQLTKIRPYCPVCRGRIEKTLKVYL